MTALIVYHTLSGHTRRAAEDIAEGMRGEGLAVRLLAAGDMTDWDLTDTAIVVVGSPCHAGSIALRSGLASAVRAVLKKLGARVLSEKIGGAFSVHCAYGGHRTVRAIEKRLAGAGAEIPAAGIVVRAGVPFSVATGPMASEEDRQRLRQFGRTLARAAKERNGEPPARQ